MNSNYPRLLSAKLLGRVLLALAFAAPLAHAAPTLWTGTNVAFTNTSPGVADVLVPGKVSLTRGGSGPLYNPAAGETFAGTTSPKDTMWAFGELTNFASLNYVTFFSLHGATAGFDLSTFLPNKSMVVHLLNEDIYLAVKFSFWTH